MPGDQTDATFLIADYKPGMTTAELIKARTRQLLRLPDDMNQARQILAESRARFKKAYDQKFARRLKTGSYKPDTLVLVRNNQIENSVSIERKTADRYMGPYRIVRQTTGGSYILAEMDGSLLRHHVAAYRLIPYIQRQELDSPTNEITEHTKEEKDELPSESVT
jgi:hypothetical protein